MLKGDIIILLRQDISLDENRTRQDHVISEHEQSGFLGSGWAGLKKVPDVIQPVKFPVTCGASPIIDDVVAKVGVHRALKADVATVVVSQQVVVPADSFSSCKRGITMPGKVQALAENAPLDRDPVGGRSDCDYLASRPTQRQVIGDAIARPGFEAKYCISSASRRESLPFVPSVCSTSSTLKFTRPPSHV